jgi:hypothetical protein
MDTYHVVLFLHLLALFIGIGAAAVIAICLFRLRAAQSLADAAPWGMLAGQTEKAFPVAILGLFGSGAYMTSDVWTWSTNWIDVSIAGLVIVALQGPFVAGTRAHKLKQALMENGPGVLGEKARSLTCDRLLWTATFANIGVVLGIVWNMTQKPGTGGAIAAIAGGYVVGAAIAWRFGRAPVLEAAPAVEPA